VELLTTELQTMGRILVVALVLGAGLPVLFSVGIRAMAYGAGGDAENSHAPGHPVGRVVAVVCFTVVVACVAVGITYVVASGFGKALDFSHVLPTVVDE